MKTKEQAAQEYADENYPKCGLNDDWVDDGFDEGYNAAANPTAYKSFIAGFDVGVEFAVMNRLKNGNQSNYNN